MNGSSGFPWSPSACPPPNAPPARIDAAIRLGKDAAARAALREKLAVCVPASPVFDPAVQARALEDAFEAMWTKLRA